MSDAPTTPAQAPLRLEFIDALRGLAVIFMIHWHTADGWISPELRETPWWSPVRSIGGWAAPLFFFVTGVAVYLMDEVSRRKGLSPAQVLWAGLSRGAELILLGYVLRFQMWATDRKVLWMPVAWPGILCIVAAFVAGFFGLRYLKRVRKPAGVLLPLAAVLFATGAVLEGRLKPDWQRELLRLDVLQGLGLSILLVAGARHLFPVVRRPLGCMLIGFGIALLSQPVSNLLPGFLPEGIAAYVGSWELPKGVRAISLFPIFPWGGYAFVGCGVITLWQDLALRGKGRAAVIFALVGAPLTLITTEGFQFTYKLIKAAPFVPKPLRLLNKTGVLLVQWGAAAVFTPERASRVTPLRTLGKASLMIYWVHLPLAFGRPAKPFRNALGWGEWAVGLLLLTTAMYFLSLLWLGPVRARLRGKRAPSAAA